jgi:DNA-binding MarR family transcriptional regulator
MVRQEPAASPPPTDDLGIVDGLAQLSFLIHGTLARRAGSYDVSIIQMRLLGVLRDRQPTMNELAAILELDKSSITGLVDRAERRDLVRRTIPHEDRRAYRVSLTRRGRALANRVAAEFQDDVVALLSDMSERDQNALSRLASQVVLSHANTRGVESVSVPISTQRM